ncbi:acetylornithine deacetylase [Allopusillimonas soli]|uniref:Acetylornithine deacetylase n=1 Tax=Allopusillimonas soli TaxID=659016 RepID=A0A853FDG5_9BURK|nr:acetylornithine deacetylase [Allopusillimonas soli]NYT37939.1 acetylornithine deacetylase [Allopusillimonas soli]TEA73838.1 acetylornithine deacetylase [Allopusillimonas soli]
MTPQSLEMITRLVGFDTVSRNSNLELIHYVSDYLASHGIHSHLVSSDDGGKANLFATIGPSEEGGVVLSGHTDVVPVDGQPWDTDPFTITQKDGRLYGRGTCDMKSFSAVALAMVPHFLQRGIKRPIHLALSYDEEIGCFGAPSMIDRLVTDIPRPHAVIVGEPTSMRPIVAHKGIAALRTTVTGHEAHSSQVQRGVSAVTTAARLITFIDDMMAENREQADPECRFVPPYTTLHTGVVNGGTALNIISRTCSFVWDIRTLPGDDWRRYLERFQAYADSLLPAMQSVSPAASIHTEILADAPPLQDQGGAAQQLVFGLCGHAHTDVVPYAAEAGQFQERGFEVVLCGPGSIDQAHQPNEYIDVSQVSACERFFEQLADQLAS